MRITEVRAVVCDVPLSRPIILGEIRYDSRDYLLVELRTDTGLRGIGYGLARYAPLVPLVERNIAPLILGEDPVMSALLWDRMYYRNLIIGQRGLFMRALSAVDIALWDLRGKAAGVPVWKLLGGARREMPALVAGGYVAKDKSLRDLAAELEGYRRSGYRHVKIAAGDLREDTARLEAARAALGEDIGLSYDVHAAWRSMVDVVPTLRGWERFRLEWIEDPFPSEEYELNAALRAATGFPLAIGEDYVGRWQFRDLLRRGDADYLRVDATVAGGLTETIRICGLASATAVPISPHLFPDVHVHLAAAVDQVVAVEVTEPAQEIDVLDRLLVGSLRPRDGMITAPDEPGLAVTIDWDAVERFGRADARAIVRA